VTNCLRDQHKIPRIIGVNCSDWGWDAYIDDIGVLVESNRESLPTASLALRVARFARKREHSKPEKYCAGSRRSAHVPAMLGMSVGDRWSGTIARWGERIAGERAGRGGGKVEIAPGRDDGLSRTTSGGLVLYNVSLLLILHRGIALPFFLPPRFEREKSRRADAGPTVPIVHQVGGLPLARGGRTIGAVRRSAVHFPRFFFPRCLVVTPQIAGRWDDRSLAAHCFARTTILKITLQRARPAARVDRDARQRRQPSSACTEKNKPVVRVRIKTSIL